MGASVLLALAGAGANQFNTSRTAKKQANQNRLSRIKQGRIQDESDARLNETLNFAESSSPEKDRSRLQNDFLRSTISAKGETSIDQVGDLSEAFTTGATASNKGAVNLANDTAGLFARIDAAGEQRRGEGFRFGDNAADIARLQRETKQEKFLNDLRLSGIRPSPLLGIISAGLSGASSGVAANRNFTGGGSVFDILNPRHPDFVGPPDPSGLPAFRGG